MFRITHKGPIINMCNIVGRPCMDREGYILYIEFYIVWDDSVTFRSSPLSTVGIYWRNNWSINSYFPHSLYFCTFCRLI